MKDPSAPNTTKRHKNSQRLDADQRAILDALAWSSIDDGLTRGAWLPNLAAGGAQRVLMADQEPWLHELTATFVTLHRQNQLRGCIGALQAWQPLAQDVVDHAFAAAFSDPRFNGLHPEEREELSLHISVLEPPHPIDAPNEEALIAALEPGLDGVILHAGRRRGTFLPSVWEQLPDPHAFIQALKHKAGIEVHVWPKDMEVSLYRVQEWQAAVRERG